MAALKRIYRELDSLIQSYHSPKWLFMIDMCISFLIHGSTPNEYMHFQFYKLKHRERKLFLTYGRTNRLEKKYNAQKNYNLFWDKEKFNACFSDFVKRGWLYTPDATEREIHEFISRYDRILAKPTSRSSGHGIYLLDKKNYNIQDLIHNKILLEECVAQNNEMAQFNQSSVNTVRIYTVLGHKGTAHLVACMIRVGGKGNIIDNYHNGGCGFPLDEKTGIIGKPGVDFAGKEHLFSPSTGFKAIGFQVPNWETLVEFVSRAACKFSDSRLIAWDIAITKNNFELIEGNYKWSTDFMQAIDKKGRYRIIKNALAEKTDA